MFSQGATNTPPPTPTTYMGPMRTPTPMFSVQQTNMPTPTPAAQSALPAVSQPTQGTPTQYNPTASMQRPNKPNPLIPSIDWNTNNTAPTLGTSGKKEVGDTILERALSQLSEPARREIEYNRPALERFGYYNLPSIQRMVGVYMNPNDPNAKTSVSEAYREMLADDIWAKAMDAANAWPPTEEGRQKVWEEHWYAKNGMGRDPLEGHPAAIQMIKDAARQIMGEDQQAGYDMFKDILPK
jgi:hypothetical protein